jgi:hypothetical protein
MVIQLALLTAVQAQPDAAVTFTEPVDAPAPTEFPVLLRENVQLPDPDPAAAVSSSTLSGTPEGPICVLGPTLSAVRIPVLDREMLVVPASKVHCAAVVSEPTAKTAWSCAPFDHHTVIRTAVPRPLATGSL